MADKYCHNKYDGGQFTGETRTVTQPSPESISGTKVDKAPVAKTRFVRGQPTGNL